MNEAGSRSVSDSKSYYQSMFPNGEVPNVADMPEELPIAPELISYLQEVLRRTDGDDSWLERRGCIDVQKGRLSVSDIDKGYTTRRGDSTVSGNMGMVLRTFARKPYLLRVHSHGLHQEAIPSVGDQRGIIGAGNVAYLDVVVTGHSTVIIARAKEADRLPFSALANAMKVNGQVMKEYVAAAERLEPLAASYGDEELPASFDERMWEERLKGLSRFWAGNGRAVYLYRGDIRNTSAGRPVRFEKIPPLSTRAIRRVE